AELREELTALGVTVAVETCDVADRAALAAVLDRIPAGAPLRAVVHAAGVTQQSVPLEKMDVAAIADVVSAKVGGAVNLEALLGDRQLDAFVVFASISGVWGSSGQAAYSAANAYLEALAQCRRARGLAATSVAWGGWAEAGMVADEDAEEHLLARGLASMPVDLALTEL
ncbi:SDR family NAD(P)-dependent oxidoreductase, partial [Amycolatopsis sp. SID8362]|uniref:SDR family NAD(P)-dependent oxidoreductase n=1 Tax=Amycolatopsis sp. SID8362 TaxID=2690346 RepID=UPI00136CD9FB